MSRNEKISKQGLIGLSQFFSLKAAKEGHTNILWNGAEVFSKTLSFSNLNISTKNNIPQNIVGAACISVGSMIDDLMISNGVYQEHNIAKFGCAMYAGYKIFHNDLIKASMMGLGLFGLSKFLSKGDIINTMRFNTRDCIKFSEKVSELSDGHVNPYHDLYIGTAFNIVFGGGRQFLHEFKLEMGKPISDVVEASITAGVNIGIGSKSEQDFKNILLKKFLSIDEKILIELGKDYKAQKVMENLLLNIDKASGGITKTSVNYGVKNAWQQILAGVKEDIGLSTFIASNLFNNFKTLNEKKETSCDFEIAVKNKDIQSIREQLKVQQQYYENKKSYTSELFSYGSKVFETLFSPFAAAILVSAMQFSESDQENLLPSEQKKSSSSEQKKWYLPEGFSEYFMPVTSTLGMSLLSTEDNYNEALDNMIYLHDRIEAIQNSF